MTVHCREVFQVVGMASLHRMTVADSRESKPFELGERGRCAARSPSLRFFVAILTQPIAIQPGSSLPAPGLVCYSWRPSRCYRSEARC